MVIDANGMSQLDHTQVIRKQATETTDGQLAQKTVNIGSLITEPYDYIALTYVAAGPGAGEIETVTYKSGGSAGTTVATLTLSYDASNRIQDITRS